MVSCLASLADRWLVLRLAGFAQVADLKERLINTFGCAGMAA